MKVCAKCRVDKLDDLFNRRGDGLQSYCRDCQRKDNDTRWEDPERRYAQYKRGAEKRGLAFDIPLSEFIRVVSNVCIYCKRHTKTMGIDRVDNSKGYVRGNCMPCCKACNYMKGDEHTASEFTAHCELVAGNHKEEPSWQSASIAAQNATLALYSSVVSTSSSSTSNSAASVARS